MSKVADAFGVGQGRFVSKAPFVRSPYNYDTLAVSDETGLRCDDPSLAQQHFKQECDINWIVDTFARTGELPQGSRTPQFGDFTSFSDYHTALNQVKASQEAFMSLPAQVRSRFGNDPGQLLDFVADEGNYDEAVKLGLIEAPKEDLSSGGERVPNAQAKPPVGKSGQRGKPAVKTSNDVSEGDLGDE